MLFKSSFLCLLLFGINVQAIAESFTVVSPNEETQLTITCSEEQISYTLAWHKETLFESSRIALDIGEPNEHLNYQVLGIEKSEANTTWRPTWGQSSQVQDHFRELKIKLLASGTRLDLLCRVYDEGVGFRFLIPKQEKLLQGPLNFYCEYRTTEDLSAYFSVGEREPKGPIHLSELASSKSKKAFKNTRVPMLLEVEQNRYVALIDTDLYSAKPFDSARISVKEKSQTLYCTAVSKEVLPNMVTPWRVILLGNQLGDLLVNNVTVNLAAPCAIQETSWIQPGKGLWDWRIHGYDNGEFKYGIDTRSYIRLIDFAAEQGIEYLTIDDHWFESAKNGKMVISPKVDIPQVMNYAKEKGVRIILYYDQKKGNYGDDQLFAFYHRLGSSGMKYGFMGDNASFTRNAMEQAAKERQLIFFHDGPTPMTGVYRTLPNVITREYCHAQQDSRRAFSPTGFLKMAMINALTGPLDQANGNFGIKGINAGERKKGPRRKNSYVSTVVSEVARTLVIFTGLITLPDAPEEYLKKADLFEFLKQMPATWDESQVINCRMGEYITTARRSGDTWFVGSVNNESERELSVALDFLEPDKTYEATIYQDAEDSHGLDNPELYDISKQTVVKGNTIQAKMALGGGHAMILKPQPSDD